MKTEFVNYLWNDAEANRRDEVERLIYRSNILGSDQRITNTGGGNTSSKIVQIHPLTGEEVEVLWVKGSGGDLRTSKKENFASLSMQDLNRLREKYEASPGRGLKSDVEDAMVTAYPHCTFNLNSRAASIDTPLHGFVPHKCVDHTHPNAVISIAAAKDGEALTKEIYGDEVAWLSWQRPGFDLGLKLKELCQRKPNVNGAVLGQHGLINWAEDDKACYELTLELIERAARFIKSKDRGDKTFGGQKYTGVDPESHHQLFAEILPWIRGQIGQAKRSIGTVQFDSAILRFVNSHEATRLAELGTSCPDHFIRTKIKPLYVPWDPSSKDLKQLKALLAEGLQKYRLDYQSYYQACRKPDSPPMRDSNPTVILVPGLGMIAWGKDKSESRVTAEFYNCAVEVMRGAEAISQYAALPKQEAFDIEYWQMEEAKLRRMPAEKELARTVVVVVGAGNGIGREVATRLVREGAQVVAADRNDESAETTSKEIMKEIGEGIGVAGSEVSACGPAISLFVDICDRASVRKMFQHAVLAYGGVDGVVVTAAVSLPTDSSGHLPDEKWEATLRINVMGSYCVADEVTSILREQGLSASVVLTSSANAVVPKKGMLAYDASKAAVNHLVRELAIELAPIARVNGVAPATVVEGSSMFPRERLIVSLKKYNVPFREEESSDELRQKLARFYAERTLTKKPITVADQAEAYFLLLSNRLSKTTGQILAVDGGLHEAFLR